MKADTNGQRERKKLMQGYKLMNLLNDWCRRRKINDGNFNMIPEGIFSFLSFSVNGQIVRSAFLFHYTF